MRLIQEKSVVKTLADFQQAIATQKVITILGEINEKSTASYGQQYEELLGKQKLALGDDITLIVSSWGGRVSEGNGLIDLIQALNTLYSVTMVGLGKVGSCAVSIFLSIPVEQRVLMPRALVYCHQISATYDVKLVKATTEQHLYMANETVEDAKNIKRNQKRAVQMLVDQTKITRQEAKAMMETSRYLSAPKAVKLGFAARVLK